MESRISQETSEMWGTRGLVTLPASQNSSGHAPQIYREMAGGFSRIPAKLATQCPATVPHYDESPGPLT